MKKRDRRKLHKNGLIGLNIASFGVINSKNFAGGLSPPPLTSDGASSRLQQFYQPGKNLNGGGGGMVELHHISYTPWETLESLQLNTMTILEREYEIPFNFLGLTTINNL